MEPGRLRGAPEQVTCERRDGPQRRRTLQREGSARGRQRSGRGRLRAAARILKKG